MEHEINFQEEDLKKLFSNKELLENYFEGLMSVLTNIEQGIIMILYEKQQAMTKSKLRSLLVDSYFFYIMEYYFKYHPPEKTLSKENAEKVNLAMLYSSVKWRPSLGITLSQARGVVDGFAENTKEKKGEIMNETKRFSDMNDVMIKNKIVLPSINIVDSSLKNLKRMGLVSFRYVIPPEELEKSKPSKQKKDYQRELWFLNPKFRIFMSKL